MPTIVETIGLFCVAAMLASFSWGQQTAHDHATKNDGARAEDRVAVSVPQPAQERAGLRTEAVARQNLTHTVRTIGSVVVDQSREARVSMRISGWVEKIYANYVGKSIKKGEPLFEFYSPDLISTQNEYLSALREGGPVGDEVARTAAERMRLWGVSDIEISKLKDSGKPKRTITFYSPVDGVIIAKGAVLGSYVTPETELYYLADLSAVWLLLTLYESDLSLIRTGDGVEIVLSYDTSKKYVGEIDYIYPELNAESRTARARVTIRNADGFLRPGMFADASIKKTLPDVLVVPDDAVIDTGVRRIVFVKTGGTTFEPREVKTGPHINGQTAILAGVDAGDHVVVSAGFLIDAESRMQAALRKGKSAATGHGEHGKK